MEHKIDVKHQPTAYIRTIHEFVQQCLEADKSAKSGQVIYGVREHPGWHTLINSIERELALRDEMFQSIEWEDSAFFTRRA